MEFNENYFEIYKDQFNYYNLIQKINHELRLYFNKKTKKFVIINIYKNYEICKEFDTFFENILQDLRFYRIENFNQILKLTEEHNDKINQKNNDKFLNISQYAIGEVIKLNNRSKIINNNDINKIIGATKC